MPATSAGIVRSDDTRKSTWNEILENLTTLQKQYAEENSRRLEKARFFGDGNGWAAAQSGHGQFSSFGKPEATVF